MTSDKSQDKIGQQEFLVTRYYLLVTKIGALHLAVFEQPAKPVFFSKPPVWFLGYLFVDVSSLWSK